MSQLKLIADSGGGTVAIKAPTSTTGNAALDLTVPGTASGTLDTLGRAGNILQVKQTFKNDAASTSGNSHTAIPGLTVSITPSSTSSKILYQGSLYVAGSGAEAVFRLTRTIGGTLSNISGGDTFTDDEDGSFLIGGSSLYRSASFQFLDSPNTTNAITYGINWQTHSGTIYLNRTWDAGFGHGASAITVMEVSA